MNGHGSQRGSILVVVLFLAGLLGVFAVVAATVQGAAVDFQPEFCRRSARRGGDARGDGIYRRPDRRDP